VVVAPDKGIKTLQELVAAAKAKAGAMTFGTAGVGSSTHFTTERFRFSAGFEGVHVPFRGMPEVLTEVMTGRVDFCFSTIAAALPFIRDNKLLALAVSTPKRSRRCPRCRPRSSSAMPIPTTRSGTDCSCRPRTPARDRREARRRDAEGRDLAGRGREASPQGIDPMPITSAGVRRADQQGDRPRASRW
jgi:hypothetical protein